MKGYRIDQPRNSATSSNNEAFDSRSIHTAMAVLENKAKQAKFANGITP